MTVVFEGTTTAPSRSVNKAISSSASVPAGKNGHEINFDRGEWITQAHCRHVDPDALFVKGAEQRKAAVICRHCPVLTECRADALDNRVEFGVWGGLTERQRRALLRKNPHIESWAEYLAAGGELHGI